MNVFISKESKNVIYGFNAAVILLYAVILFLFSVSVFVFKSLDLTSWRTYTFLYNIFFPRYNLLPSVQFLFVIEDNSDVAFHFLCRLAKELKEKEESLLICQQVCKRLQEEVAEKERKEGDLRRRTSQSESELETLKALLTQTEEEVVMLKQER